MLEALLIVGVLFAAFIVAFTVLFNLRGRKVERALTQVRGTQNAASFAEMFTTEGEQIVARVLYPRLESLTFTRELPLSKEDRLFSRPYSGSILSQELTAHCLSFDEEDLWDDVVAVLTELRCEAPKAVVADELQVVETVGQLVSALARVTYQPVNR